jgi:hypothetical protein
MLTTCLACGQELAVFIGDPDCAPWLCNTDRLAFWSCELAPEARAAYRPAHRDWGHKPVKVGGVPLEQARLVELVAARIRNTSLHPHALKLVPTTRLHTLNRSRYSPSMQAAVATELTIRQNAVAGAAS